MNRIRKKYNRIFKESFIEYKLESFEISKEELAEKKEKIQDFINFIKSGKIKDYNEEQLQARWYCTQKIGQNIKLFLFSVLNFKVGKFYYF